MKATGKVIIVLFFIFTLVVVSGISIYELNKCKEENLQERYSLILESVYEAVENEMGRPIDVSLAMASDVFFREFLLSENELDEDEFEQKMAGYLTGLKEAADAQTAFFVSDHSKKYYTCAGVNKIVDPEHDEHDIWYSVFVNSRKKYDFDVDVDQANANRWTVFVNTRIEDSSGRLMGVCGIGLPMDRLQAILKHYEEKYDVKVNFVDSDGVVQVDIDAINIENTVLYDVQYSKEKDGYAYKNANGEYVTMRFVNNLNWYLVIHGDGTVLRAEDVLPIAAAAILAIIMNLIVGLAVFRYK